MALGSEVLLGTIDTSKSPMLLAKVVNEALRQLFPAQPVPRPTLGAQMLAYKKYHKLLLEGGRSILESDLSNGFTSQGTCLSALEEDSLAVHLEAAYSVLRRVPVRAGQAPWAMTLVVHRVRITVSAETIDIKGEFLRTAK